MHGSRLNRRSISLFITSDDHDAYLMNMIRMTGRRKRQFFGNFDRLVVELAQEIDNNDSTSPDDLTLSPPTKRIAPSPLVHPILSATPSRTQSQQEIYLPEHSWMSAASHTESLYVPVIMAESPLPPSSLSTTTTGSLNKSLEQPISLQSTSSRSSRAGGLGHLLYRDAHAASQARIQVGGVISYSDTMYILERYRDYFRYCKGDADISNLYKLDLLELATEILQSCSETGSIAPTVLSQLPPVVRLWIESALHTSSTTLSIPNLPQRWNIMCTLVSIFGVSFEQALAYVNRGIETADDVKLSTNCPLQKFGLSCSSRRSLPTKDMNSVVETIRAALSENRSYFVLPPASRKNLPVNLPSLNLVIRHPTGDASEILALLLRAKLIQPQPVMLLPHRCCAVLLKPRSVIVDIKCFPAPACFVAQVFYSESRDLADKVYKSAVEAGKPLPSPLDAFTCKGPWRDLASVDSLLSLVGERTR